MKQCELCNENSNELYPIISNRYSWYVCRICERKVSDFCMKLLNEKHAEGETRTFAEAH